MPSPATATVTAIANDQGAVTVNTTATFGNITFKEAGTYSFTITEDATSPITGITYSQKEVIAKATVTADSATGGMTVNWTYAEVKDDTGTAETESYGSTVKVFTNTYDTSTTTTITATKSMAGEENVTGTYSFTLTAAAGIPMPDDSTTNDEGVQTKIVTIANPNTTPVSIDFGEIKYWLADMATGATPVESMTQTQKTFTYTVQEVRPNTATAENNYTVEGIRYDPAVYTVIVTVTYDSSTGTLTAGTPTYSKTVDGTTTTPNPAAITFVNEEVTTVTVTKAWKKADGTDVTPPAGTVIVLDLYKGSVADANKVTSITLNGTVDGPEAYPTGNSADNCESGKWIATWSNLPKYEGGTAITYMVKEAEPITSGYTVKYSDDGTATFAQNGGTITNTLNETTITIVKVDASNTSSTLTSAVFELKKEAGIVEGAMTYSVINSSIAVEADGSATLADLTDGTYLLTETQAPAGYNLLSGPVSFTVSNGVVTFADGSSSVVEYEDATNRCLIKNTPGVELPSTGGTGTTIYTLTGLTLLLGASLILYYRRRRREQN